MNINYTVTVFKVLIVFLVAHLHVMAQNPSRDGKWSDPIPFGIVPVSVANLPDGNLIVWSAQFRDTFNGADAFTFTELYDPTIGENGAGLGEIITNTQNSMFCPGITNLPNGNIMSAGGSSSQRTSIYDYKKKDWVPAANMNQSRGYQGNVTLSDGSVFTIGGSYSGGRGNKYAEIWTLEKGWRALPSLKGEMLADGNVDLIDEPSISEKIYRTDNHAWLVPAPNGKIFHAGPGTDMHWIDVRNINNPTTQNVGQRLDDTYAMNGTAVLYDIGKILKVGGSRTYSSNSPASSKSYIIDINNEIPKVTRANGFKRARMMHNSVVLPNGKVLITGGIDHAEIFVDNGSELVGEIFDPKTNKWSDTAPMAIPRTYHSVSILMQDGRVFVGGGGLCASYNICTNHFDAEIYSPSYLFDTNGNLAKRPIITTQDKASFNSNIAVRSWGDVITEFNLIRFSSATHNTNNEQRRVPLKFKRNGRSYDVDIPGSNLLPPGYYMLFAMNAQGVPSVSETIQIGDYGNLSNIEVGEITITKSSVNLFENDKVQLNTIISPFNASNKNVTWASNDTNIATVDVNGVVTAKKRGTAIISATSQNQTDVRMASTIVNVDAVSFRTYDFESGDLSGWEVVSGDAFSDKDVTTDKNWAWGGPFRPEGNYHLWGYKDGRDPQIGSIRSTPFILGGNGEITFKIGGGFDISKLYLALMVVTEEGEQEIKMATGDNNNSEDYTDKSFIASKYIGQTCYLKLVDNAKGGWGHINLDDVRIPIRPSYKYYDFESGNLAGWTVTAGNAFADADVTNQKTIRNFTFNQQGYNHLWGFKDGADRQTGSMRTKDFIIGGDGIISLKIGGGANINTLYVALVSTRDNKELLKITSERNGETLFDQVINASKFIGQECYLKVVDNATGGWGHLNLDDIRIPVEEPILRKLDFESGNLEGWTVESGNAFNKKDVTTKNSWSWGGPFNQQENNHLWGFNDGGDSQIGSMRTKDFIVGGDGVIRFLISGGFYYNSLYFSLVSADTGKELARVTGDNNHSEAYIEKQFDAFAFLGQKCYLKLVDNSRGSWGHLNLDDVRIPTGWAPGQSIALKARISNADNEEQATVIVYPNPTQDWLNIDVPSDWNITTLTMVDMTGRKVFFEELDESKQVNVDGLTAGIYVGILQSGNQRQEFKLIVN